MREETKMNQHIILGWWTNILDNNQPHFVRHSSVPMIAVFTSHQLKYLTHRMCSYVELYQICRAILQYQKSTASYTSRIFHCLFAYLTYRIDMRAK